MAVKPCCFDCLTEDVTVKVIDQYGFEHWFCAVDWAAHEALRNRIQEMFAKATEDPDPDCAQSEGCLFDPECVFYETCRELEREAEEGKD